MARASPRAKSISLQLKKTTLKRGHYILKSKKNQRLDIIERELKNIIIVKS
jgi:hypothetical protein